MLQIGVTAVKEKARELGLEKLAKSRWLERAGHISRHFDNRSYAEMAGDLASATPQSAAWHASWG